MENFQHFLQELHTIINDPEYASAKITENYPNPQLDNLDPHNTIVSISKLICCLEYRLHEQRSHNSDMIIINEMLAHLNDTTAAMVDSLGQGFLTFDMEGTCDNVYSKACLELLEVKPSGKNFMDVLCIKKEDREELEELMEMIFIPEHAIDPNDLLQYFPKRLVNSKDMVMDLSYRIVEGKSGEVMRIVVIATDITQHIKDSQQLEAQEQKAGIILNIIQEKEYFYDFMADLNHLMKIIDHTATLPDIGLILQEIHSIKGIARVFGLNNLAQILHDLETDIANTDVSVESEIMKVLEKSGELLQDEKQNVINIAELPLGKGFYNKNRTAEIELSEIYNFAKLLENTSNADIFNKYINNIVSVPIFNVMRRFNKQVLDLSERHGTLINPIKIEGENIHIIYENYTDFFISLSHLFNNIVEHAIEDPMDREDAGKNEYGNVIVTIQLDSKTDSLNIIVKDDGAGINPDMVREKLKQITPDGSWQQESDAEIIYHIFDAEFSTRNHVSLAAGRGIGMAVIQEELDRLGGSVKLSSKIGEGTTFIITVPYNINIPDKY